MIKFNDGSTTDAFPYFTGTICTIYDAEPNTTGFFFDGMDFSDFTTLYRKGNDYFQLSNDGGVCQDENEKVPSKEKIQSIFRDIEVQSRIMDIENAMKAKKEELSSTDYIIIKMAEGVDVSQYDIERLKQERQALRDGINSLEAELSKQVERHDKVVERTYNIERAEDTETENQCS